MFRRLRANRSSPSKRLLLQENYLHPADLVVPFFLLEGTEKKEAISSMPGIERLSLDYLTQKCAHYHALGVQAVALFPIIDPSLKTPSATEALNPDGLIPRALRTLRKEIPSLCLISDIALDPYTSHGHDGIVNERGEIDNDTTLPILVKQALLHAEAGADIVAPSDMMDGRIKLIRQALNEKGLFGVSVLSYTAKFASALYAPFRTALKTRLSFGDKKSYQMNPANQREALLEALTDLEEGADMLLVKPGLPYLDIVSKLKEKTHLPIGAFHVSGEYAMVMAAHTAGILDKDLVFMEMALAFKRAGADFIFTYAIDALLPQM